ncbi:MAG: dynamin family protein [Gammaproteobacteria bacterium]|nr:MAG: dynamin family protein [Gammaproteobacteria bacterium]
MAQSSAINERFCNLSEHLRSENPILLGCLESYRQLDEVGRKIGLLTSDESWTNNIPWWPLISILGTFSAGKSTFINDYIGKNLQKTGNQAVDDKFSVLVYSSNNDGVVLPGIALDSDSRFPFYQMSADIDKETPGEGTRIDAYLQLKPCSSDKLKGKIIIDSPGFDADAQRTATLQITEHIVDLSDLVLVFFDARHPEPGAMRDTLKHLVSKTILRKDSNKFLYILNQIDTTAREDNPEDITAAWQRALGQEGLSAGKFYSIYNEKAASPIEDEALAKRFKTKKDADLAEILDRMEQIESQRSYRIVGSLEKISSEIEKVHIPKIKEYITSWRKKVLVLDGVSFAVVIIFMLYLMFGSNLMVSGLQMFNNVEFFIYGSVLVMFLLTALHFFNRHLIKKTIIKTIIKDDDGYYLRSFIKNCVFYRSIWFKNPAGWHRWSKNRLKQIVEKSAKLIQKLNDSFTNPSGKEKKVNPQQADEVIRSKQQ